MIKELVNEKNEILSQVMNPFDFDKDDAKELSSTLIENMKYYGGVGLAANQIGINARVFAMIKDETETPVVIFNPEIIEMSEEEVLLEEGCLSFVGLYIKIRRPKAIVAKHFNENGDEQISAMSGMQARIFLHEYDHLNGIRFTEIASKIYLQSAKQKRKQYVRKLMRDHH